ncbi:MAG: CDP-glucose 4,6-dehydratase [Oscillibacter sp.]|jgi:CDP-glucose 4,6-dehydratase|nr:CDP-glucose 4,6-dehydratase [Oscillibacter sp.]
MAKDCNLKNKAFYKGKRVFVTGHTGYKGAWLAAMLSELGAQATCYALEAPAGSMFEKMHGEEMVHSVIGDVRDYDKLHAAMQEAQPEIVLHLAAQAIVNDCFQNPRYAYESNVMGTVNLLEAVRACPSVKSVMVVTTDKVYENKGDGALYVETDPLGGVDPYSSSKTCMEYITDTYKRSYLQTPERMVGVCTARASNVLGGGDYVQSRLIPSILRSIAEGKPVELRHPHQTRPWQSMMDALNGYLSLGRLAYEEPEKYSSQWNIGPTKDGIKDVLWVVEKMQAYYADTHYVVGGAFDVKESGTLGLDITKSLQHLDWEPLLTCDKMLYNIVEYYKLERSGMPVREIVQKQIREFFEIDG